MTDTLTTPAVGLGFIPAVTIQTMLDGIGDVLGRIVEDEFITGEGMNDYIVSMNRLIANITEHGALRITPVTTHRAVTATYTVTLTFDECEHEHDDRPDDSLERSHGYVRSDIVEALTRFAITADRINVDEESVEWAR